MWDEGRIVNRIRKGLKGPDAIAFGLFSGMRGAPGTHALGMLTLKVPNLSTPEARLPTFDVIAFEIFLEVVWVLIEGANEARRRRSYRRVIRAN